MVDETNNPLIEVYNRLYSIIDTYVQDPNSIRRAKSTTKEKQWIFPETPESVDQFYPIVAIILDDVSYEENGSGRFFEYQDDAGDKVEINGNWITLSLTIGVFSKKLEKYSVTLYKGSEAKTIKGKLFASYLANRIAKIIDIHRGDFFINEKASEVIVERISDTYTDSETLWTTEIPVKITMPNIWSETYTTEQLIAIINKDLTVER